MKMSRSSSSRMRKQEDNGGDKWGGEEEAMARPSGMAFSYFFFHFLFTLD